MIRGIHHVAISTPDADRLLGFYRDLLGLQIAFEQAWPEGTEVADRLTGLRGSAARQLLLGNGHLYIELFEYRTPTPRPSEPGRPVCDHGVTHVCLEVEDVDALHERLAAAGVEFHCPPVNLGGGVRTTYARDPDGNVVELQQLARRDHPFALPIPA